MVAARQRPSGSDVSGRPPSERITIPLLQLVASHMAKPAAKMHPASPETSERCIHPEGRSRSAASRPGCGLMTWHCWRKRKASAAA